MKPAKIKSKRHVANDKALHYRSGASPYCVMIGTGGVGSGSFFAIEGDQTLGREESRAGQFLERKDYCKLHIISHYVSTLLGDDFTVIPASRVGDDAAGRQLIAEIRNTGMDDTYIEITPHTQTLFSFCFLYPDGSGGNLTTSNAANEQVDAEFIERLEPEFIQHRGQGIALAAPEVPLAARLRLLELASQNDFYRVSALTSQEARGGAAGRMIGLSDLLALNLDEAAALSGLPAAGRSIVEVIETALQKASEYNPSIHLSITAGKIGSWCWDGNAWTHTPALRVRVAGTAGAGDAHLAAIIAGMAAGLRLPLAQQLGSLAAAFSVTSPDTIHHGLNRASLARFARRKAVALDPLVAQLLFQTEPPAAEIRK
jgi:ribokinase